MLKLDNCPSCNVEELQQIVSEDNPEIVVLDVRTKGEFKSSNIPGSKNIPLDDLKKNIEYLKKFEKVYIYCHNGTRTDEACKKLSKEGFSIVSVKGGIVSWRKAGYAINSSSDREVISLQRQVQITAGSFILLGFILSKLIDPNFIYISVIMGAGLLFTGISGSCMMAKVLIFLPWNK